MVEPVRLGLVGVGGMGASHLKMEHGVVEEVHFTALCDVNRPLLEQKSRELDLPGFADYHALIDSGRCEAVLIATPHPFHAPVAIYAARRGLHVLTEKPIAVTVSEADAMVDAAREHGALLGVMFQERTHPLYRTAHRLVSSGALGPLYHCMLIASHWFRSQPYYDSGTWRGTWKGEGGGVLMNQAPHSLDLFIWLAGQPRSVTAQAFTRGHDIEVEDTVSALLDYGGGYTGYLYTTTAQWPGTMRLELSGEYGQLAVEDDRLRLYRLAQPLSESLRSGPIFERPDGSWEDVLLDPVDGRGHVEVVRRFAHAVREGTPLVADGVDGLRALELANAVLFSGYTGQRVTLPLDRGSYDAFLIEKRAGT
jgi:predicted dehydrogenase